VSTRNYFDRSIDVQVMRLRRKLRDSPDTPGSSALEGASAMSSRFLWKSRDTAPQSFQRDWVMTAQKLAR
jgi:hypothetical protein